MAFAEFSFFLNNANGKKHILISIHLNSFNANINKDPAVSLLHLSQLGGRWPWTNASFPQWKTAFLTKIPKYQRNLRYRIFHEYFIKEVNGALDSRKIASVAIYARNKQK